jgi:precorrin-6A synthase
MRKLYVIGIGTGNPEHVTAEASAALNRVDVFFVMDKGADKADLVELRKRICDRFIRERSYRVVTLPDPVRDPSEPSYTERVNTWHEQRSLLYEQAFACELSERQVGAILVWGDPSLYDSTLRILDRIAARGALALPYEVLPGISAVQLLAARHRIALNRIGGSVHITTGRQLQREFASAGGDIVVMLDGELAFKQIDPAGVEIYWGAYLGSEAELLVSGALSEKAAEIEQLRSAARARHGWIMDTYLLRKS